jgi:hypothetical protein
MREVFMSSGTDIYKVDGAKYSGLLGLNFHPSPQKATSPQSLISL